jgi:hypothetical protein
MNDQPFFVVGYPKAREFQYVEAIGPFPDQAIADEFILNVLKHIQFKIDYIWQTVWLRDPNMYRRPPSDVSV